MLPAPLLAAPLLAARRTTRPAVAALAALLTAGLGAGGAVLAAGPAAAAPALSATAAHPAAVSARQRGLRIRKVPVLAGHSTRRSPLLPAPHLLAPRVTTAPTATFQVTYDAGFTPQARTAFQAAVDTWSHIVVSKVPIKVNATWQALGSNVLGQAAPHDYSQRNNAWLPYALADAEQGSDVDPGPPDIDADFSSDAPWYYGTAGTVPTGEYDLQSVVTHELGHGLGFTGSYYDDSVGIGSWGGGTDTPFAFDNLVTDRAGHQLDRSYANNSTVLGAVLTGSAGPLQFTGAHAKAANGNVAPVLYTPSPYSEGSSTYHLDEATYPEGSANALMTPILVDGEAVHDPGPIVRGMMLDLGWPASGAATPIAARYAALGGTSSVLGTPVGGEYAVPGGTAQNYTWGRMYYSAATGVHEVHGAILSDYLSLGGPAGVLRLPVTDETRTPDGVGRYNHFSAGGSVYWTPSTSAHAVYGAIRARWAQLGWELGPLGYPTTDETGTPDGVGRYNHFSKGGSVYWSPSTSAHAVYGAIRVRWAQLGWELGRLGYPTTDEYSVNGGRRSDFQHGSITWTAWGGAVTVTYR